MNNPVFAVILVYFFIASTLAFITVVLLRQKIFGHIWGAFLISLIGATLGGLMQELFRGLIERLSNLFGIINIFPPLIAAILCLLLYTALTKR